MSTLLVSGAGLGETTLFGTTSAANTAQGALAPGWQSDSFALPRVSADLPGRNVTFDFTVVQTQSGANVRLDFDTLRPVLPSGLLDESFGTPVVTNKALGIFASGWDSQSLSIPLVSANLPGRNVSFNFTLAYTQSAANVGLYFDGKPLTTGVSAGYTGGLGGPSVVNTATATYPEGIPPPEFRSVLFVGSGASLNFNFVADYTPPTCPVRFDFTPTLRPVLVPGFDASYYGTPTLTNAALGIAPLGLEPPPLGLALVSVPSPGRQVVFNFVAPYTPITGINVAFAFGEDLGARAQGFLSEIFGAHTVGVPPLIFPTGISSLEFGTPRLLGGNEILPFGWDSLIIGLVDIGGPRHYMRPDAIDSLASGVHFVSHQHQVVKPFGWRSSQYGRPSVFNTQNDPLRPVGVGFLGLGIPSVTTDGQVIRVAGIDSARFGIPDVVSSIGLTQLIEVLGGDHAGYGVPYIADEIQHILQFDDSGYLQFGLAIIGLTPLYIYPERLASLSMGRPATIRNYPPQTIRPPSVAQEEVGQATVAYGNTYFPAGIDASEFGTADVRSSRHYIVLDLGNQEQTLFGQPRVYNLLQFIEPDSSNFGLIEHIGVSHAIANVDRVVRPYSWLSSRSSTQHRVLLPDQPILPLGIAATAFGTALIAYQHRHVYPKWTYAGYLGDIHMYNASPQLLPSGFDAARVSKASVFNSLQRLQAQSVARPPLFGRPRIGWFEQAIQQSGFDLPVLLGTPVIGHGDRYVVAEGIRPGIVGTQTRVFIPPPLPIRAHAFWSDRYGVPRVSNATPQFYPSMADQLRVGYPWISHSPRTLVVKGIAPKDDYGIAFVALADRTYHIPGIDSLIFGQPTLWQDVPTGTFDQIVAPSGIPPEDIIRPTVTGGIVAEGWDSRKFGESTSIYGNGIFPRWDWADSLFQFGTPSLNATQWITQTNRDGEEGAQTGWSMPRIEPHTIWATYDVPQQALENHPNPPWYPPGFKDVYPEQLPPFFGTAFITTPSTQYVVPPGIDGTTFGPDTAVESTIRYIYPPSIRPTLFGYPTLNGPHKFWARSMSTLEFGTPTVYNVITTQWAVPPGINSLVFGPGTYIELLHRPIYPAGFLATLFGDNNPMVYHYPRGPKAAGFDSSVFGEDTWISDEHRSVFPEGFESFEEGYTLGMFEERLKVSGTGGAHTYTVGDSLRMGTPSVTSAREPQRLGPYMIPPPDYCHPHALEEV